uniref:SPOR domain-containing protein n=1 Tax=candidate division WOR-3 bacterium TaxID=2052148 RepID=A0A7C4Y4F5_UNCW3
MIFILFFLSPADSLFNIARKEEDPLKAMEIYRRIISDYSKTPFSDSSILRIGMFDFVLGDYKGTINTLNLLLKSKDETIVESAKYWISLCYITIGDTSKSLEWKKKEKKNFVYAIQIGAFREERFAKEYMKKFRDEGYDAYIVKIGELIKVFVGKFPDKASAQEELKRLKENNYIGYIQYICLP